MSEAEGGGQKSEQATAKRLRDARKEGQVASSSDMARTATSVVWLVLLIALPVTFGQIENVAETILQQIGDPVTGEIVATFWYSAGIVFKLTVIPVALVAIVGVLVVRLQSGPVFAISRIAPRTYNLSMASGLKRLFSLGNMFETLKGIVKTVLILGIVVIVLVVFADDILILVGKPPLVYAELDHLLHVTLLAATTAALLAISAVDWLFQRFNYLRSLRMSKQEVRRERRTEDGDPALRSQRRRLQRQWASGNARQASRDATALVVNPTHLAVALYYDAAVTAVPQVTAIGEGELAALMRLEAASSGVPIMRSVPLARRLCFLCEDDDEVPEALFDAVAEVLAWAEAVRADLDENGCAETYREADRAFDHLAEG